MNDAEILTRLIETLDNNKIKHADFAKFILNKSKQSLHYLLKKQTITRPNITRESTLKTIEAFLQDPQAVEALKEMINK